MPLSWLGRYWLQGGSRTCYLSWRDPVWSVGQEQVNECLKGCVLWHLRKESKTRKWYHAPVCQLLYSVCLECVLWRIRSWPNVTRRSFGKVRCRYTLRIKEKPLCQVCPDCLVYPNVVIGFGGQWEDKQKAGEGRGSLIKLQLLCLKNGREGTPIPTVCTNAFLAMSEQAYSCMRHCHQAALAGHPRYPLQAEGMTQHRQVLRLTCVQTPEPPKSLTTADALSIVLAASNDPVVPMKRKSSR